LSSHQQYRAAPASQIEHALIATQLERIEQPGPHDELTSLGRIKTALDRREQHGDHGKGQ
jgi:hypothetical protein